MLTHWSFQYRDLTINANPAGPEGLGSEWRNVLRVAGEGIWIWRKSTAAEWKCSPVTLRAAIPYSYPEDRGRSFEGVALHFFSTRSALPAGLACFRAFPVKAAFVFRHTIRPLFLSQVEAVDFDGLFGTTPSSPCFDQFHIKLSEVPTYIPNTSSPPFVALFGVACAPLLSALRTCAFPRDSLSSFSCRSFLNALAVVRSSFVCSVPIFIVYDSHLYDNSCGEIEWMRRIDCNSPRTLGVRSVTGGIAKKSLSSFLVVSIAAVCNWFGYQVKIGSEWLWLDEEVKWFTTRHVGTEFTHSKFRTWASFSQGPSRKLGRLRIFDTSLQAVILRTRGLW